MEVYKYRLRELFGFMIVERILVFRIGLDWFFLIVCVFILGESCFEVV